MVSLFSGHNSFIWKMNPTLKVICCIFLIALSFLSQNTLSLLFITSIVVILFFNAKISLFKLKNIFKFIFFILLFIFVFDWFFLKAPIFKINIEQNYYLLLKDWNIFFNWNIVHFDKLSNGYWIYTNSFGGWIANVISNIKPTNGTYVSASMIIDGHEIVWYLSYYAPWYSLNICVIINCLVTCIRVINVMVIFLLLTTTISAIELSSAFKNILYPLKFIKIPIAEISLIITLSIKFVPNLLEQVKIISNAQATRGLDIKSHNIKEKIKALVSLVIPMFSFAFNQTDRISDIFIMRGYTINSKKIIYKSNSVNFSSIMFLILLLLLLIGFSCMIYWRVIITPIDCFV